jgi:hypothetical protein
MLKHIVLYKLHDSSQQEKQRIVSLFRSMIGNVSQLRSLETGYDVLFSERSYDVALICEFDDMQALKDYKQNPEHLKVAVQIRAATKQSVSVDYEF